MISCNSGNPHQTRPSSRIGTSRIPFPSPQSNIALKIGLKIRHKWRSLMVLLWFKTKRSILRLCHKIPVLWWLVNPSIGISGRRKRGPTGRAHTQTLAGFFVNPRFINPKRRIGRLPIYCIIEGVPPNPPDPVGDPPMEPGWGYRPRACRDESPPGASRWRWRCRSCGRHTSMARKMGILGGTMGKHRNKI